MGAHCALSIDEDFHQTGRWCLESECYLSLSGCRSVVKTSGIAAIHGGLVAYQTRGWVQIEQAVDHEVIAGYGIEPEEEPEKRWPEQEPPVRIRRILNWLERPPGQRKFVQWRQVRPFVEILRQVVSRCLLPLDVSKDLSQPLLGLFPNLPQCLGSCSKLSNKFVKSPFACLILFSIVKIQIHWGLPKVAKAEALMLHCLPQFS